MKSRNPNSGESRFSVAKAAVWVLIFSAIACVAMRLLGAWLLSNENNGDLAIVQMMVRNIIAGKDFPVFFYGQAYMGALEPFANALTHILFGFSNFGTEIGTALFTLLSIFFAYRLARRAGGMVAAAIAVFFCICGPIPFFHYAVSPRGGYGVLLFVTTAALDQSVEMVSRAHKSRPYTLWHPFFFGFLAGIGFWNNQLCAPAVAAGAFCIIACSPGLLAKMSLWVMGFTGFLLGSLPFWIWNIGNNWESFGMSGSITFDPVVIARNIWILFTERWGQLFGLDTMRHCPTSLVVSLLAASAIPLLSFLGICIKRAASRLASGGMRKGFAQLLIHSSDATVSAIAIVAYLALFFLCFVFSHFAIFNTPRYLVPLVPVLGVVCGMSFAASRKRAAKMLIAISVVVVVGFEVYGLKFFFNMGAKHDAQCLRNEEVVEYLKGEGIDCAYCLFLKNSLNLAGDGTIAFSDKNCERIPEFRRRLEMADAPAVIENFEGIATWAQASGGSVSSVKKGKMRVATSITPPSGGVSELPASHWHSVTNSSGQDVMAILSDRSKGTAMPLFSENSGLPVKGRHTETLTIDFSNMEKVSGVRIHASAFQIAENFSVYFRDPSSRRLLPACEPIICDPGAFWSGPRFYPSHVRGVRDIRFNAVETDSVTIEITGDAEMRNAVVYGLQVLTPSDNVRTPATVGEWKSSVDNLLGVLSSNSISRLYATRYVANRVYELSNGKIWTNHGADLTPKMTGLPAIQAVDASVSLDEKTAILLPEVGTHAMPEVATERELAFRRIEVPLLGALFIPEAVQNVRFGIEVPLGIDFENDIVSTTPSCEWMANMLADSGGDMPADTIRMLFADNPSLVPLLEHISTRADLPDIADKAKAELKRLTMPEHGDAATFGDAVTWRGCRILSDSSHLRRGESFMLRHYWSAHSENTASDPQKCVMVHFVGPGGYRFQGDFEFDKFFTEFDTHDMASGNCTWHTDICVQIPENAPCGGYEMRIGVYSKMFPTHRYKPQSSSRISRNAETVADFLVVE